MKIAAFILAGGRGDRVHGPVPKIELSIAGLPCFQHLVNTVASLPEVIPFIVASPHFAKNHPYHAIQHQPRGTGDAVRIACEKWGSTPPDYVLVLYADVPLIQGTSLQNLIANHQQNQHIISLLSFRAFLPHSYGRIVEDPQNPGHVLSIMGAADEEREVSGNTLAHSGVMMVDGPFLWDNIHSIQPNNAQNEFYLTDIVKIATSSGRNVGHTQIVKEEALGLNTWSDWVVLENIYQTRARSYWFSQNALVSAFVRLYHDTKLAPGVTIDPFVTFGPNVTVHSGSYIHSYTHLSECTIHSNSQVGPFAHVHKNTTVGENNAIGNFVECVRSTTGSHVKAKHLAYLGDAELHHNVNIGAGCVTANYDGFNKHTCVIEPNAWIGANTTLISPTKVGNSSIIGAGSTISDTIDPHDLALTRAPLTVKKQGAQKYRNKKKATQ